MTALAAVLLQPEDCEHSTEKIKNLRKLTADFAERDAAKAHRYAEMAAEADPTCYQALYELASDYMFIIGTQQNLSKAQKYFEQGLKYAEQKGDDEYTELFKTRIDQVKGLIKQSKSESNSEE